MKEMFYGDPLMHECSTELNQERAGGCPIEVPLLSSRSMPPTQFLLNKLGGRRVSYGTVG